MNIYAKEGDIVVFVEASDAQVSYGGQSDPRETLEFGCKYAVEYTVVGSYRTKVKLIGIKPFFNSVHFADFKRGDDEKMRSGNDDTTAPTSGTDSGQ